MKKAILVFISLGLLAMASCRKDAQSTIHNVTYQGGSWTFGAVPYNATSCAGAPASAMLTASGLSGSGSTTFTMTFGFTDGYPATGGTYTVLNGHNEGLIPLANFVMINATLTGAINGQFYSSGGNGDQKVTVTVANGKISLSGQGIEMLNAANASDSTVLSLNITQTQ
jgi:hypothetical protein